MLFRSCTLGRESAIQKVCWDQEGWLGLSAGGRFAKVSVPEPGERFPACDDSAGMEQKGMRLAECGQKVVRDEFEGKELPVYYTSPRVSYEGFADLAARPGYLRLKGQESLNSLHHVSLIALRQQTVWARAVTGVEFKPDYPEQAAGLAYLYDAMNFYLLVKTADEQGQSVLTL